MPQQLSTPVILRLLLTVGCCGSFSACDDSEKRFVIASNEGVEALHRQDYAGAEQAFKQASALRPRDGETHYYLGVAAVRDPERLAIGIKHFQDALAVDPAFPEAWIALARAQYEAKQVVPARTSLNKLFELDPGHPNGHLLRAKIALTSNQKVLADEELRAALAGDGTFVPAYSMLARLYTDVGGYDAARLVLEEGLRLVPDATELQELIGVAWLDLGRPDRAKMALDDATAKPRVAKSAYLNLANACLQLGEKPAAIQALKTFLAQSMGQKNDPSVLAALKTLQRLQK